jgi:glucosamine--fructose-6-phosphate aminotransferase (isomerizing)
MLTASHLHKEIHEQPLVLRAVLEQERGRIAALAADIVERDIDYVMIAARGTSDNAGRYAQYLLGAYGGLPVALATPSLFSIYGQAPRLRNALVLGISQSGKSPDIVSVLAEARRQGALTAALTNFADSDLAQQADHVIGLNAGEERSVAATKTYTAELMAIAMLGAALNGRDEMREMLATVPEKVAAVLEGGEQVAQVVEHFKTMSSCVVIGRGYNYATAFELALKLEELTYTLAMPYSSADFLHGPVALIEKDFPVVLIE